MAEQSTAVRVAGKRVGAAASTIDILRFAIENPSPWTATEASRAVGLNPSTCFNIVQTLVGEGMLECEADSKRYVVGAALTDLARMLAARTLDFGKARPCMQAVADRFRVTVTLWKRRSPTRMELVLAATCNSALNIQMPVGQRLPLLVGGMGRIMAMEGGLTPEQRAAVFAEIRWDRALTMNALMAQARQAKRLGWGLDDGYMNRSVMALAVAVPTAQGAEPIDYVCSATMFRHQYSRIALQDVAEALKRSAESVGAIVSAGAQFRNA